MSGEDWSDYSSDDPEYEISDHSEMSDSDGSYSDTDDDKDIPTVSFNNWNVLSDPFANKIPRPLQDFSADYDFHPAIDFQEWLVIMPPFMQRDYWVLSSWISGKAIT
ncbi:hypothetical protein FQA39_LY01949 [Lamprigera yunnana]|nr:hypothetical protein FQA39_LY01949 [Lamprigera yunnana]